MNLAGMVNRVQALVGRHSLATADLVTSFINSRHNDMLEAHEWSRKKQELALIGVPDKSQGTVDLTSNSTTVIGHGTAWTASDVGKYIKFDGDDYSLFVVRGVNFAQSLVLGDLMGNTLIWPGNTSENQSYVMLKRIYSLGPGVGSIITVKQEMPIKEVSEEYLDSIDPGRTEVSATYPMMYARVPWDQTTPNDIVRIELYPRPTRPMIITVEIKKCHTDLLPSDNPIVPSAPLEWFSAVDTAYALFARTKEQKWLALAESYNKEGEKSLEFEKNEDYKKWGRNATVRDVYGGIPLRSTDFAVDHDTGWTIG